MEADLAAWVRDARTRTLALVADLSDEQLIGPRLAIVNPLLWEIGHLAWFQEKWALRHAAGRTPIRADGDALYDSAAIPHDARWDLPLPTRAETLSYLETVRDRVLERLEERGLAPRDRYFIRHSIFHEDMHGEAFVYTRQTLGLPAPRFTADGKALARAAARDRAAGDAVHAGGVFALGADPAEPFVFDNEKWAHPVEVKPFALARAAVTQAEFAAFVDDDGYRRDPLWSDAGRRWRESERANHPVYWRRDGGRWFRRAFDEWVPLEADLPVLHVSWHEADAYCRWAGRRLPTEAEWELAAAGDPKRRFPWGGADPDPDHANLDGLRGGGVSVHACAEGDTPLGCRQLFGNAWEWTASDFLPYPGFVPDPYAEYSQPWFGTHKVLRGGCWATRARLLRATWRNFYPPDRRDVWAGFRTAASLR